MKNSLEWGDHIVHDWFLREHQSILEWKLIKCTVYDWREQKILLEREINWRTQMRKKVSWLYTQGEELKAPDFSGEVSGYTCWVEEFRVVDFS